MNHPAKFSDAVLGEMAKRIPNGSAVLDPFAGVGTIHRLWDDDKDIRTFGVEIEPEWAEAHPKTQVGDATMLEFQSAMFDVVATSPTYGNRMADHHDAKDGSKRVTYKHALGRDLSTSNTGQMQWGIDYRMMHEAAWKEVHRVLMPGGLFLLNISNHIREGKEVLVSEWHLSACFGIGFKLIEAVPIPTKRMRYGQNHGARVDHEWLFVLKS